MSQQHTKFRASTASSSHRRFMSDEEDAGSVQPTVPGSSYLHHQSTSSSRPPAPSVAAPSVASIPESSQDGNLNRSEGMVTRVTRLLSSLTQPNDSPRAFKSADGAEDGQDLESQMSWRGENERAVATTPGDERHALKLRQDHETQGQENSSSNDNSLRQGLPPSNNAVVPVPAVGDANVQQPVELDPRHTKEVIAGTDNVTPGAFAVQGKTVEERTAGVFPADDQNTYVSEQHHESQAEPMAQAVPIATAVAPGRGNNPNWQNDMISRIYEAVENATRQDQSRQPDRAGPETPGTTTQSPPGFVTNEDEGQEHEKPIGFPNSSHVEKDPRKKRRNIWIACALVLLIATAVGVTVPLVSNSSQSENAPLPTAKQCPTNSNPEEGDLCLFGGDSAGNRASGRLEVYHKGEWGTVCKDSFGPVEAGVACLQLGFSAEDPIVDDTEGGEGMIWLDEVSCSGSEDRLVACQRNGYGKHDCSHSDDVSLACLKLSSPTASSPTTTPTASPTAAYPTVAPSSSVPAELCLRTAKWNSGFSTDIRDSSATASIDACLRACDERLGSTLVAVMYFPACSGSAVCSCFPTAPNVQSSTTEDGCWFGSYYAIGSSDCPDSLGESSPAVCPTNSNPSEGDLCLFDGGSTSTTVFGRLEVYHDDIWGTVCDDGFGPEDASVACRQLGYSDEDPIVNDAENGTGTIWLDDVACTGTEDRLVDCNSNRFGSHNCGHTEDVGLICRTTPVKRCPTNNDPDEGDLCLFDGGANSSAAYGRLEVYVNEEWGTVCDDSFGSVEAGVACGQLGFISEEAVVDDAVNGTGNIWLDQVSCSGSEDRLVDCDRNSYGNHDCSHSEDVALVCLTMLPKNCPNNSNPSEGDLCLFDAGSTSWNAFGRLEVYYNGEWGTVCDDSFGSEEAQVACRQLGYSDEDPSVNDAENGTGPIWLDQVSCSGSEDRLVDCQRNSFGNHDCGHSEDVALECLTNERQPCPTNGSPEEGDLCLFDGTTNSTVSSGRLEVYINGEWGTVCDDSFGSVEAGVACRQLGFSAEDSVVFDAVGGRATIWLDQVSCSGSEDQLVDCESNTFGNHDCSHSEDVGLECVASR